MRESPIGIEIKKESASKLVISLSGEVELFNSSLLKRKLSSEMLDVDEVVFDLSGVEYVDSYFIKLLIHLRKRLGGISSVTVINVRPGVLRIFEVTGLDKLFIR